MDSTPYAAVDYSDAYVQPLILSALRSRNPELHNKLFQRVAASQTPRFQFRDYEKIDFENALKHPNDCLINAYIIRKALIRKHFLSTTIANWITKHPSSVLKDHFKPAVDFELDYAEFLDDALIEAFELHESFQKNDSKEPKDREWWILKPSMSDRGQGIKLFSTEAELQAIFEEWEADQPDSDAEAEDGDTHSTTGDSPKIREGNEENIITSQLRHFIAQPYIHPPLLLEPSGGCKFHIRTYILAVGALRVYVYRPILALFAAKPYHPPWSQPDLRAHLTNTCIQDTGEREGSVRAFWDLPDEVSMIPEVCDPKSRDDWKVSVFDQICKVTGEVFEAAARGMMVHFQPLPNAFELFGLDFLVDAQGSAWLLEVNAFPDFKQTGDDLKSLVAGLFEEVVDVAIKPFFNIDNAALSGTESMTRVLDIDLGRR